MNHEYANYVRWCNGNTVAADMLQQIGQLCQLVDDVYDADKPATTITDVTELALVRLPTNPFYREWESWLKPAILCSLLMWQKANEWQKSSTEQTRMWAFVMREIDEQIIGMTAYLCGGWQHALKSIDEAHKFYRQVSPETFAEWSKEVVT